TCYLSSSVRPIMTGVIPSESLGYPTACTVMHIGRQSARTHGPTQGHSAPFHPVARIITAYMSFTPSPHYDPVTNATTSGRAESHVRQVRAARRISLNRYDKARRIGQSRWTEIVRQ